MEISRRIFKKLFAERNNSENQNIISSWIKNGRPLPPPHLVKQLAIKNERDKGSFKILIETGTYLGDMVQVQKKFFKKVYSIELGEELYNNALKRFERDKNVVILKGDSGVILNELMPQIEEPAIFWLDGHWSEGITAKGQKECPIIEELTAILDSKKLNHSILIDDARLFTGTNDYPNIEELRELAKRRIRNFSFTIEDDIIRIALLS